MQYINYYLKRLPKFWERIFRLGILMILVLIIVAMFRLGCFSKDLFKQPDSDRFLAIFFKESFIILLSLFVAWYITSLKYTPSRVEEYKFLNSLPIPAKKICYRFIYQDLLRFLWVPGIGIFLYFSLLPVSPISHLCRLSILASLTYILFIVSNILIHFFASLRRKNSGNYIYPGQNNPIIVVVNISGYAIFQMSFIILPPLVSGYQFWIVFCLLLMGIYFSFFLTLMLFSKWQLRNLVFHIMKDRSTKVRPSWFQISSHFQLLSKLNPLLFKNLIKIHREKNAISIILTVMFILIAYFISMNNEYIKDSISVLLAISSIYSFLFALHSINRFSAEEECPELIYTFPLKKSEFYLSVFIPAITWLVIVIATLTILILISGSGVVLAGLFWLKSLFAALTFLFIAVNYAIAFYPDIKGAQKHFFYWILTLILLTTLFYKYRIIVIILMVILSFSQLRKIKFYRIS